MRRTNIFDSYVEKTWRRFSTDYFGKMAVNWHVSSNFGDVLSVYIAEKLSKREILSVSEFSGFLHYQVIGSILSLANRNTLVWGTGFANRTDSYISEPREIYMIRGQYSLEICRKLGLRSDIVLGDPGYIVSKIYRPENVRKRYELGVIPHWVDYDLCKSLFSSRDDILVVNLLNADVEAVIDQIVSCKKCISSSLHGLVVSHSYDIPCMHVNFTDRLLRTGLKKFSIGGDGVKFLDYFSSVGIQEYSPLIIEHIKSVDEIDSCIPKYCGDKCHISRMIESCPFVDDEHLVI